MRHHFSHKMRKFPMRSGQDVTWDEVDGVTDVILMLLSVISYYVDWLLDAYVAYGYYRSNHVYWAGISIGIFVWNMLYQVWEKPTTFLWKEAWYSIKAKRRTQAFNELNWSEAVSEAPLQVLFQTYAVTYMWQDEAPGVSQLLSIALSLFNISVTNLQRQEIQYAWVPRQHAIYNWVRLSPYIIYYFCEAAYRTIAASLLVITLRAFSPITALFMLWYRHKLVPLWEYDESYLNECTTVDGSGGTGSAPSSRRSSFQSPDAPIPPGDRVVDNPLHPNPRSSFTSPGRNLRSDSIASSTTSSTDRDVRGCIPAGAVYSDGHQRSASGRFFTKLSTQPLMRGQHSRASSTTSGADDAGQENADNHGGDQRERYFARLSIVPKLIGSLLSDVPARVDPVRHLASAALMAMECSWFVLVAVGEPLYTLPFERYVVGIAGVVVGGMMMLRLFLEAWVNGEHYKKVYVKMGMDTGKDRRASSSLSRLARNSAHQKRHNRNQGSLRVRDHTLVMLFGIFVFVQAVLCSGVVLVTGWSADECFEVDCGGGSCIAGFGSYTCVCHNGYEPSGDGVCIDVDECETEETPCGSLDLLSDCTNLDGTYSCTCSEGFASPSDGDATVCEDVDECDVDNSLPHMSPPCGYDSRNTCANSNGAYSCTCGDGFIVTEDERGCDDVDECMEGTHSCANSTCGNTDGGYTCTCHEGYMMEEGSETDCVDVNECATTEPCGDESVNDCSNSIGGYSCTCGDGFIVTEDERGCEDENECEVEEAPCGSVDQHSSCANILDGGGYACSCSVGFMVTDDDERGGCEDVNECDDAGITNHPPPCGNPDINDCTNSIGGYSCTCGDGFIVIDDGRGCGEVDNGCASGVRAGFTDELVYPDIAACDLPGGWTDLIHEASAQAVCSPSFHVCRYNDPSITSTTYNEMIAFGGCYAYDVANDCGKCHTSCHLGYQDTGSCLTDAPEDPDIAGVGSGCSVWSNSDRGKSCAASGRIDSGRGCNWTGQTGVVCCRD